MMRPRSLARFATLTHVGTVVDSPPPGMSQEDYDAAKKSLMDGSWQKQLAAQCLAAAKTEEAIQECNELGDPVKYAPQILAKCRAKATTDAEKAKCDELDKALKDMANAPAPGTPMNAADARNSGGATYMFLGLAVVVGAVFFLARR